MAKYWLYPLLWLGALWALAQLTNTNTEEWDKACQAEPHQKECVEEWFVPGAL